MYTFSELRVSLKQALDRAKITPVKVLRGKKEVFWIVSDKQWRAIQIALINKQDVHQQGEKDVHEPEIVTSEAIDQRPGNW